MAIKRIPCGGFFYDDESIEFDGRVIKASGGGSGVVVVNFTISGEQILADKTPNEVKEAMKTNTVIGIMNNEVIGNANIMTVFADSTMEGMVFFGFKFTSENISPFLGGVGDTWQEWL